MNKELELILKKPFFVIAGPCAIESKKQLEQTAEKIISHTDILRGGAFKPRTFPGSFEGLGEEGLKILKEIGEKFQIPTITEVMDTRDIELVAKYTDILQIGARNMQNYPLLKEAGKLKKPILLKRGLGAKIKEWLAAAEYIKKEGNLQIILCERGIRTFENETRFTLDFAGAILAKQISNLPVIIDPSHATGKKELIKPLVLASKAAGLSGVMIEAHIKPKEALCDADQALTPEEFNEIFS
ncbi:MAG: 3-deoxy-7-phosphoheptulonate synthase [Patescibacteria group bacterium]